MQDPQDNGRRTTRSVAPLLIVGVVIVVVVVLVVLHLTGAAPRH
jgi:hypothetical protein